MQIQPKILKSLVARVAPVVSTDDTRTSGITMLHVFASEGGASVLFGTDGHRIHRATRGDVRELLCGMHAWYRDGSLPPGWGYFPVPRIDIAAFKSALETYSPAELHAQTFGPADSEIRDAPPPCATVLVVHNPGICGRSTRQFFYPNNDRRVNLHQVIPVNHDKRASIPFSRLEEWAAGPKPSGGLHDNALQAVRIYGAGAPHDPMTGRAGWAFGIEGGEGAQLLAAVHRPYFAEAVKACKRRGSPSRGIEVQLAAPLDPVVFVDGDPYLEPTSDSTETFTAVVMPIRL